MPNIDIALPDELQQVLKQPVCLVLPTPGKVKITLPSGPKFSGIADITKQIPDDCSLSFSLVLQLTRAAFDTGASDVTVVARFAWEVGGAVAFGALISTPDTGSAVAGCNAYTRIAP